MTVNEFAQDVHKNAVAHGWYDAPITFPEVAVMIHAEISEAVEEWRSGNIEAVLMAKHEYNKGREYRHGGKRA